MNLPRFVIGALLCGSLFALAYLSCTAPLDSSPRGAGESPATPPAFARGGLSLKVSWPTGSLQAPLLAAALVPATGAEQDLPFAISGAEAAFSSANLATGSYLLELSLSDGGLLRGGALQLVQVSAETTPQSYEYAFTSGGLGAIQVHIVPDLDNPLGVSLSGATPTMSAGSTRALSACVSNYSCNVCYVWYVNGQSRATGSCYSFGPGLGAGYYRIDVDAYAADGSRAGSAMATIRIY